MPHPAFVLLTAAFLAVAMAMLDDRPAREMPLVAARIFLACLAVVAGGGWLMRLIHG